MQARSQQSPPSPRDEFCISGSPKRKFEASDFEYELDQMGHECTNKYKRFKSSLYAPLSFGERTYDSNQHLPHLQCSYGIMSESPISFAVTDSTTTSPSTPSRIIISQRSGDVTLITNNAPLLSKNLPKKDINVSLSPRMTPSPTLHSIDKGMDIQNLKQTSPPKDLQFVTLTPTNQNDSNVGNSREKPCKYVFVDGIDEYDIRKIEEHVTKHNRSLSDSTDNDQIPKTPPKLIARKGAYSRSAKSRSYDDYVQTFQLK
jgi:hypothetical protein